MSKVFNIGITLLILISVVLLCSCVALYIIKENEIEKRIFSEKRLEGVTLEKDRLLKELEELKSAKMDIELKLVSKEKDFQNLQEKFDLFRTERDFVEEKKSVLINKLSSTQKDFLKLKEDYQQLQQTKEMLEQRLKNVLSSGVKLEKIIVEPKGIKKTVEGEVLAVNKDYEFLVINLGLANGITDASEISVYRDSELIAMGGIEKLYENISAVAINDREQLKKVKIGDLVVGTLSN